MYYINDTTKVTQVPGFWKYDNSGIEKVLCPTGKTDKAASGIKNQKWNISQSVCKEWYVLSASWYCLYGFITKIYADKYINVNICDGLINCHSIRYNNNAGYKANIMPSVLMVEMENRRNNQDIMSTNPHSSIVFDKFVKVDSWYKQLNKPTKSHHIQIWWLFINMLIRFLFYNYRYCQNGLSFHLYPWIPSFIHTEHDYCRWWSFHIYRHKTVNQKDFIAVRTYFRPNPILEWSNCLLIFYNPPPVLQGRIKNQDPVMTSWTWSLRDINPNRVIPLFENATALW